MKIKPIIALVALSTSATWLLAAQVPDAAEAPASAAATQATAPTEGEVKKVDLEQGKITLKHRAIENLGMPGMTMVFRIDAAMLSDIKAGDAVSFRADRVGGAMVVTQLMRR